MLKDLVERRQRIRDFFSDSVKGFLLIWRSAKKLTVFNLLLFVLQAIIPLFSFIVLKSLIDQVVHSGSVNWQQSGRYLLAFAALQMVNVVISELSSYYQAIQQQHISDDIAVKVLNKAVELDLECYENPSFYDELHMVHQQSLYRPAQLIITFQSLIQSLITIVLFSGFMLMVHWSVLLLLLFLGIPLAVSKLLHGYQQFLLDKNVLPVQRKAADLFSYLTIDVFAKEVRIFNFGDYFIKQFLHLKGFVFQKKKQLNYKFLKRSIAVQFFEIIITTIIYCILIACAVAGTITVGGLVIYFQVFQRLQTAINNFFQAGIQLFQHQLYLRQILKYLAMQTAISKGGELPMPPLSKGITVNGLNFTYPDTQREILHNISMNFKPGTITAIVGQNGSGKSTLIKLLCRLYNIERDKICIDDVDMTDISTQEMRNSTTAIFQDFGKYYLTVEENITLGHKHENTMDVETAAIKSGLHDFIASLPAQYKTYLGRTYKNSEQLSGGQWQKLALARGLYKNNHILILDEPTSAIDPVAEHTVFQNLKAEIKDSNKIIILVTHRLYNLKMADHIYVMENGAVVEDGSFNALLSGNGLFANIYEKQGI